MRFSIIMPVLNEEEALGEQLVHLRQQGRLQDCEILIVDGGSNDSTVAIGSSLGRVIKAPRGRATQMNAGAAAASGEVFIFLHADTQLPASAFAAIEEALANAAVVAGAFRVCFNCDRWPYRLVALTTNLRSRLRTILTGDQAYFVRAESFRAIGGFPEQALMEDLEIIKRLRTSGKVVLLPHSVLTSARRHEKLGLARSVLLMWYLRTLYRCGVSPARLQQLYLDIR